MKCLSLLETIALKFKVLQRFVGHTFVGRKLQAYLDIRVFIRFTEHPPQFSQGLAKFSVVEVRVLVG